MVHVKEEVDPIYEIAGIQKALDKGPILFFEKIKGYPNIVDIGNFFSRREPLMDLYSVDDHKKLKFKFVDAIREPLPPKIVTKAPCQEVVITDNIHKLADSTADNLHVFAVIRGDGELSNEDADDPEGPPQVFFEVNLVRLP